MHVSVTAHTPAERLNWHRHESDANGTVMPVVTLTGNKVARNRLTSLRRVNGVFLVHRSHFSMGTCMLSRV